MFKAKIQIIGINPYVLLPAKVLKIIFIEAGKDKGKIRIKMTIDGHAFTQTLVKFSGSWRLYLNTPMRKAAGKDVGDVAVFSVTYNAKKQKPIPVHPKLIKALNKNLTAKKIFNTLAPHLQLEIVKYIANLKREASVDRNITKAINFLLGKERFIGRDKP